MSGPTVPHFAYPLTFVQGQPVYVEQDSSDHVLQCVTVLVSTMKGERQELPSYGVDDSTFAADSPLEFIRSDILKWEPRAILQTTGEFLGNLDLHLQVIVDNLQQGVH